jgi:protein phosphatase
MQLTTAAQTDIGLVRHENEDRYVCADDLGLYAVADGIGGLPAGAEAAQTAIDALKKSIREAGPRADLARAFAAAQTAVLDLGDQLAADSGLGTTLCATLVRDGRLLVANVGDSRAYLLRSGKLLLLTHDDTVENDVIRRRGLGERVEMQERYRNALTRCLGQPMPLHVEVTEHPLQTGDIILVCSDGISRSLPDSGIALHLAQSSSPVLALGALVTHSLSVGGHDNATAVLVRVDSV